ncbi:MAG TPA: hypothetical protein VHD58_07435 [Mycobacteriales bacterium]|jgi:hypothetical protein|nr:hypothetical protein [Mycobacteriales bacterium]
MYSVVNRLRLKNPIPAAVWGEPAEEVLAQMRQVEGFHSLQVVGISSDEVVLIITADTAERLDQIATDIGSPWMVEYVVPHLAEPPSRQLGEVLMAGSASALG